METNKTLPYYEKLSMEDESNNSENDNLLMSSSTGVTSRPRRGHRLHIWILYLCNMITFTMVVVLMIERRKHGSDPTVEIYCEYSFRFISSCMQYSHMEEQLLQMKQ